MTGIVKTDQIQGAQGTTVTVPTGNTLAVTSNATVGGTLGVTGAMTTAAITSTGRHDVNFNGGATQAFKYTDTAGGNLASFGQFYNTSDGLIGNIQNANNDGIHLNLKNGSIVFSNVGYTAANALDDYEEGTWSPSISQPSNRVGTWGSALVGTYTKVGRKVTAHCSILGSGMRFSATSGYTAVTGFPFAATQPTNSAPYSGAWTGGSVAYSSGGTVYLYASTAYLHSSNSGQASDGVASIGFCITYFVA